MRIMYTPQTPQANKGILTILWLFSSFCTIFTGLKAQNNNLTEITPQMAQNQAITTLKPLKEYEESLWLYHNKKFGAEMKRYKEVTKKKWWYYLPNVGFTFGLPSVGFNTGIIAQIDRDRNIKRTELESIEAQSKLTYQNELLMLRTIYKIILVDMEALDENLRIWNKSIAISKIYIEGFNEQKVTPLEMLKEDRVLEVERLRRNNESRQILTRIFRLEEFAHYNLPNNDLIKFDDSDCILTISKHQE